jgi:hypothetical protein
MKNLVPLVPISKVFSIIDSCTNTEQLAGCKRLATAYTSLVKSKGVINSDLVDETLQIKLQEKREEIEMCENFYAR